MRNTLDGGEAIVEACRKLECKYILSSPGTEWAPVWEAMANQKQSGNSGPVLMDVWHETLAVDIAMGYTMVTGGNADGAASCWGRIAAGQYGYPWRILRWCPDGGDLR
ncbi:MAG: thiamine pyrophosphate-binding protein [Alphaproteobacteria bacterium]